MRSGPAEGDVTQKRTANFCEAIQIKGADQRSRPTFWQIRAKQV